MDPVFRSYSKIHISQLRTLIVNLISSCNIGVCILSWFYPWCYPAKFHAYVHFSQECYLLYSITNSRKSTLREVPQYIILLIPLQLSGREVQVFSSTLCLQITQFKLFLLYIEIKFRQYPLLKIKLLYFGAEVRRVKQCEALFTSHLIGLFYSRSLQQ